MANNQIALLAQMPEFDTPLESQAKAMQIRNLMNQGQVQDMEMRQRQQAFADDASTRQVFSTTDSTEDRIKALYKINPKAAQAFEKAQGDLSKDAASTSEIKAKTQTENLKAINMRMQQARDLLGNVSDKQAATTWVQGLYADPDIGHFLTMHAGPVEQALARIPDPQADPAGFNKWRMTSQLGAEKLVEETKPKVGVRNLGNRSQTTLTDPITGKVMVTDTQAMGQTPDSVASNARMATEGRLNRANSLAVQDRITARQPAGTKLGQEDITTMAEQYLAGDKSVLQGLGRGAQGAEDIRAVRAEIGKQLRGKGMGGADAAAKIAEYGGLVTGLRATGNISARVENAAEEAAQLAPLALEASRDVARSGLLPFGKAQIMFNTQTNDPALAKFATANMGLATAYASAMARGNKPTVSDNEHARGLLSEAQDQRSYEAKVGQMMKEIEAAKRAPRAVRGALTKEISGRDAGHSAPAASKPSLDDIFGKP